MCGVEEEGCEQDDKVQKENEIDRNPPTETTRSTDKWNS